MEYRPDEEREEGAGATDEREVAPAAWGGGRGGRPGSRAGPGRTGPGRAGPGRVSMKYPRRKYLETVL